MIERKIARYGWRKDSPDHRDFIYQPKIDPASFPRALDLTSEFGPVYDQGQLGSCTGNSVGGNFEHTRLRERLPADDPSRLFIYGEARRIEGTYSSDSGAEIRDCMKVIANLGAPSEKIWPYSDANPGRFNSTIPLSVLSQAKLHLALEYHRIVVGSHGYPMRSAITSHQPISFGFSVPDYFEDQNWDQSKTPLALPGPDTQIIGGHAVVVAGFDFRLQRFSVPVFKCRNSWSADWGEQGYFYMDYRWFTPSLGLADDLWVISKVS